MAELAHERVKALFRYTKSTGLLIRRVDAGDAKAGDVVMSLRNDGYIQVSVDGRRYMAHRLIWFYVTGEWPAQRLDHKDTTRTNNKWLNLRLATAVTNAQNVRRAHRDSTHGFLGVSFIRRRISKPFRSEIRVDGKQMQLGTFATAEEAHQAYVAAKRRYHEGNTL